MSDQPDEVDAAIDNVEHPKAAPVMDGLTIKLPRERFALLRVPADIDAGEMVAVLSATKQYFIGRQEQERRVRPGSRLWHPGKSN